MKTTLNHVEIAAGAFNEIYSEDGWKIEFDRDENHAKLYHSRHGGLYMFVDEIVGESYIKTYERMLSWERIIEEVWKDIESA